MSNKTLLIIAAIVVLFSVFSCEKQQEKAQIVINTHRFFVEVARTHEEQAKGLAFWMKNTGIPLSIAFLARDGKVVDLHDMKPFSENPIQPLFSYMYALELNQGAFERAGVKTGDFIVLPDNIESGKR
jgi:uncharacterized membrane protein (UPF0127 family)